MRKLLRFALEERNDGAAQVECEHTFYGRLENFEELKRAVAKEHQEQWEVRLPKTDANGGAGRIRVRKTIESNKNPEYVLTCKTKVGTDGDEMEVPVPTTEGMFEQFKLMAEQGMIKDRFMFQVEGMDLVWEIDLFYLPGQEVGSGQYYEWCKIDLEVANRTDPIPPLPFHFAELITAPEGRRTEAEEQRVRGLYDTVFVTKNVHVKT